MKYCLASLLLMLMINPAYAETLTMTTYYPAPFGAYDRMRFVPRADLAGNCAIGTLYVKSSTSLPEYCHNEGGTGVWGPLPGVWMQDSTNHIYPGDTATNSNLQVGIGTAAPSSQLHIYKDNANATMRVVRNDGGDFRLQCNQTDVTLGTANGTQLNLQTNNTNRVVIRSDGKIGINTPVPTNDLELTGNQKIIGYLIIDGDGNNSTLRFVTGGGTTFSAGVDASDGNFKINTGTTPGFNQQFIMDSAGNVTIGGKLYVKSDNTHTGEVKLRWVDSGADSGYYAMYSP